MCHVFVSKLVLRKRKDFSACKRASRGVTSRLGSLICKILAIISRPFAGNPAAYLNLRGTAKFLLHSFLQPYPRITRSFRRFLSRVSALVTSYSSGNKVARSHVSCPCNSDQTLFDFMQRRPGSWKLFSATSGDLNTTTILVMELFCCRVW